MSVIAEAAVKILPETKTFTSNLKKSVGTGLKDAEKQSKSSFDSIAKVGKVAFLAISGAAIGFGAVAIKSAIDAQKAHALLANAIKNTGAPVKEVEDRIASLSGKYAKLGFTNAQLESGFTKLVTITHDTGTAFKNIALAADLARAKNIDLSDAATIVGKVSQGTTKPLKALGISIKDVNGEAITGAEGLKRLAAVVGGAAQAQAETFAGKLQALRTQVTNLTEKVGIALIPILERLARSTIAVIDWFSEHKTAAIALGSAIAGVLVPSMALYLALQAKAFAASVVGDIKDVFGAMITGAKAAAKGAKALGLANAGWLGLAVVGIAGVTAWMHKLENRGKLTGAQIKGLAADLGSLKVPIQSADLTKVFSENDVSIAKLSKKMKEFRFISVNSGVDIAREHSRVGAAFDGVDEALASLVKKGSADQARLLIAALAKELGTTSTVLMGMPGVLDDTKKALEGSAVSAKLSAAATHQAAVKDLELAGNSRTLADKLATQATNQDKATKALQRNTDAVNLSLNPYLQLQDAQDTWNQSLEAYGVQIKENATTNGKASQKTAELARENALLAAKGREVTRAVTELTAKEVANNITKNSATAIQAREIQLLNEAKKKYPELSSQIDDYIKNHLNQIPKRKRTRVELEITAAKAAIEELKRQFREAGQVLIGSLGGPLGIGRSGGGRFVIGDGRASGGPVAAGRPYLVGERGPELFMPRTSGQIIANNRLANTGKTYNVTVNPNGLLNEAALGYEVSRQLRLLEMYA